MKTIAIINQKGGVGKTTTAVTLGHGLALQGKRTLIVDLDSQGNVADTLGIEKGPGLYRLLVEEVGPDAIAPSGRENLDIVLGDKSTVKAKYNLAERPFREQVLRQRLQKLSGYDFVVIDSPPSVDIFQISAFIAADAFLIPVALDHLALIGAGDALTSASAIREAGGTLGRFLGVLPTFWERTTRESQEQLKTLVTKFKQFVWPPIPIDTKAREAPAYGQTLWEYMPGCRALEGVKLRDGRVAGGYRQTLTRVMQELPA